MDGIAGIYSPGNRSLVEKIFLATGGLQHRGKEGSGVAVGNGKGIYVYKGLGRIGNVVTPEIMRMCQDLEPVAAIGNVGYTKNRSPERRNAEPIRVVPKGNSPYDVVLTLDGYLVKEDDLKAELEKYDFQTVNKAEVIGALLHKYISEEGISFAAGRKLIDKLHGRATFALTALIYDGKETHLIALNDDKAFEPFCFGTLDETFVASSESCSHRRLGGFLEREYEGAEMTICSSNGIETQRIRHENILPDIFQGAYFGYPGSVFKGKEIFQIRRELGLALVEHYGNPNPDIVVVNPDSGWGVTMGIAEGLGMSAVPAVVKNAQAVRTFQEGERRQRSLETGLKFGGIDSLLKGKSVAMGDDSIVKGTVSEGGSVWTVFNCGAKSLEFWVSYAPMIFPSFKEWHHGIESLKVLAVQRAFKDDHPYDKSLEDINEAVAELIGVDEVKYNSLENIKRVTGEGSFQALDASYPINEKFWPGWLKDEVEKFVRYRKS